MNLFVKFNYACWIQTKIKDEHECTTKINNMDLVEMTTHANMINVMVGKWSGMSTVVVTKPQNTSVCKMGLKTAPTVTRCAHDACKAASHSNITFSYQAKARRPTDNIYTEKKRFVNVIQHRVINEILKGLETRNIYVVTAI